MPPGDVNISAAVIFAERIAEQLSSKHYRRNHAWGMTEPVMGRSAFSEDKFYRELAAWIRQEIAALKLRSSETPEGEGILRNAPCCGK